MTGEQTKVGGPGPRAYRIRVTRVASARSLDLEIYHTNQMIQSIRAGDTVRAAYHDAAQSYLRALRPTSELVSA